MASDAIATTSLSSPICSGVGLKLCPLFPQVPQPHAEPELLSTIKAPPQAATRAQSVSARTGTNLRFCKSRPARGPAHQSQPDRQSEPSLFRASRYSNEPAISTQSESASSLTGTSVAPP